MSDRPAWISRERTEYILETLRGEISSVVGVTLQEDSNGAWGDAGSQYLSMRFTLPDGDFVNILTKVVSVSSDKAERRRRYDEECPQ